MEAQLQRRIQRYGWDRAVDQYEASWAAQLKPAQDALLRLAALRPGEHVLELACGTGLVTFPAAEAVGHSGSVLATDISDKMVQFTAGEAARRGLSQVRCVRMGAESLELPDASFDAVLCALGLMYVPEVAAALAEMHRVLAPGGRAVAAVWGARNRCGWADIFPIVESRVQSDVCPMFFQLGTGDSLAERFTHAGFRDVTTERLSTELLYESSDAAADAAFAGGPVAMAYSRFDAATRDGARADYIASIDQFREGGRYRIPGEFVIARANRPSRASS
ncbi:MAG TPA: methyltransferase domain-containing protein [Vicinamibacterales bacterium]|nr:methyltransferase domain-containing protein [Vicinamibacterales bacterium]